MDQIAAWSSWRLDGPNLQENQSEPGNVRSSKIGQSASVGIGRFGLCHSCMAKGRLIMMCTCSPNHSTVFRHSAELQTALVPRLQNLFRVALAQGFLMTARAGCIIHRMTIGIWYLGSSHNLPRGHFSMAAIRHGKFGDARTADAKVESRTRPGKSWKSWNQEALGYTRSLDPARLFKMCWDGLCHCTFVSASEINLISVADLFFVQGQSADVDANSKSQWHGRRIRPWGSTTTWIYMTLWYRITWSFRI